MFQVILSIALALVGLVAGWLKCVEYRSESRAAVRRVAPVGWLLLFVLTSMAGLSIWHSIEGEKSVARREASNQALIDSLYLKLTHSGKKISHLENRLSRSAMVSDWFRRANKAKSQVMLSARELQSSLAMMESEGEIETEINNLRASAGMFYETVGESLRDQIEDIARLARINAETFRTSADREKWSVWWQARLAFFNQRIVQLSERMDNAISANGLELTDAGADSTRLSN